MNKQATANDSSIDSAASELSAGVGVKVGDGETAKDRRERLKKVRELAREAEEVAGEEKFAAERAFRNDRRDRIFLEYAKVILEKVLLSPAINPIEFAYQGEKWDEKRKVIRFAVANVASVLTDEHLKRNP